MFGDTTQAAPAVQLGQYSEEAGIYAYQVTLTANQPLTNQSLIVDGNSDFIMLAIHGTSTGSYVIRVRNNNDRFICSAFLQNANFVGTAQFPVPLSKPFIVRATGRIAIDITDTSGASNTVELCFSGIRRYQVAA
jgi:hypothetical protein